MLNPSFSLTSLDVTNFATKGFVKLKGLLSDQGTNFLRSELERQARVPNASYGDNLSRYNLNHEGDRAVAVVPALRSVLTQVCQRSIFHTQSNSFVIQKNKSTGFRWHVGTTFFNIQAIEDFGCTLWIPLDPVDAEHQGGGVSCVSKKLISGRFLYQYSSLLSSYVADRDAEGGISEEEAAKLRNFIAGSSLEPLLAKYAESESYKVGDALLFNKNVIHCSVPLGEGPLDSRRAFVMRFIEADSTYNLAEVRTLDSLQKLFPDYYDSSDFCRNVCKEDGEFIVDSPLFQSTKEQRMLRIER